MGYLGLDFSSFCRDYTTNPRREDDNILVGQVMFRLVVQGVRPVFCDSFLYRQNILLLSLNKKSRKVVEFEESTSSLSSSFLITCTVDVYHSLICPFFFWVIKSRSPTHLSLDHPFPMSFLYFWLRLLIFRT